MTCYMDAFQLERWKKFQQTDMQYWVAGGVTLSNGDMMCQIHIQQPKPDKRFRNGKRYVEITTIPCAMEGKGYGKMPSFTEGMIKVELK